MVLHHRRMRHGSKVGSELGSKLGNVAHVALACPNILAEEFLKRKVDVRPSPLVQVKHPTYHNLIPQLFRSSSIRG